MARSCSSSIWEPDILTHVQPHSNQNAPAYANDSSAAAASARPATPHEARGDSQLARLLQLMPRRVERVLLVSSPYDSYILEEDGLLSEMIFSEYAELGLTHAPDVTRVSTGAEALQMIRTGAFDLVITMLRLGDMNLPSFSRAARAYRADLQIVLLVSGDWDLARVTDARHEFRDVDDIFVWQGDTRIFLAIIKIIEDRWNAPDDTRIGDVGVIIVVEDNLRFRSSLLPIVYTELVLQTRAVMREGLNRMQKLMRLKARTKILTAETLDEGQRLLERYRDYIVGVISDVEFPLARDQAPHSTAGIEFIRLVKAQNADTPCLVQSAEARFKREAEAIGANFIHKQSQTLSSDVRGFMLANFGFGDFVFRWPDDNAELARARDLRDMRNLLEAVPIESVEYHAVRNHFSNWLRARTEFALARSLRPRRVSEFKDLEALRRYLVDAVDDTLQSSRRGVVEDFSRERFDAGCRFARIGGGSLGGKARGLAFIDAQLAKQRLEDEFDSVRIHVPRTVVIGTDVFDQFLDENHLRLLSQREHPDDWLRWAFLTARFPEKVREDLRAYLEVVGTPVAVRSSSLLEDSQHHPFAGVYATHMIANNQPSLNERLDQLVDAVKLVYASTYYRGARQCLSRTPHRIEEEKMAVILQPVVGTRYSGYFYPSFAGVALSYNYYPFGHMKPEDGVAFVVLGLGAQVVEGGRSLRFCPAFPEVIPELGEPHSFLSSSQREFYAVNLDSTSDNISSFALAQLGLDVAEQHGSLNSIGSVYSIEDRSLYDGLYREGPRAVTFAHVLKAGVFPLAPILRRVLDIGRAGMNAPVEIEFAGNLNCDPPEFCVLQVRPCVRDLYAEQVDVQNEDRARNICASSHALGNGVIDGITDFVYVKPESFSTTTTLEAAMAISRLNEELSAANRPYILIGPGRWGTTNRWLGIPVKWTQISAARVIVETTLDDFRPELSQGSHFFHNLTSFGIPYVMVNHATPECFVDWDWLAAQPIVAETALVRHVRSAAPVTVRVDGRTSHAVVRKPAAEA